jgi:hypothetical protein
MNTSCHVTEQDLLRIAGKLARFLSGMTLISLLAQPLSQISVDETHGAVGPTRRHGFIQSAVPAPGTETEKV